MGGFTFCCGDMGPVMEAKGTVTNEILEMIEDDPRVCYINADGTGRGGRVQQAQLRYPDRILDVGIQEMNMVTIAAGLAKEGFLPYVQTFGPFLCVRALDQIHNDVAYNDYPVRLIGLWPHAQHHHRVRRDELPAEHDHGGPVRRRAVQEAAPQVPELSEAHLHPHPAW